MSEHKWLPDTLVPTGGPWCKHGEPQGRIHLATADYINDLERRLTAAEAERDAAQQEAENGRTALYGMTQRYAEADAQAREAQAQVTVLVERLQWLDAELCKLPDSHEIDEAVHGLRYTLANLPAATATALAARAKQHEPIPDTYACDRCGRRDGLDTSVSHEDWEKLSDGDRWRILCLWCMDELAAEKGLTITAELYFAGKGILSKMYGAEPGMGEERRQRAMEAFVKAYDAWKRVAMEENNAERLQAWRQVAVTWAAYAALADGAQE